MEKQSDYKVLFQQNLDVKRIVPQMAAMHGTPIIAGQTLLFIDEIQDCQEAIMALRYFKEYMPELHVVAAGSLLEFVLDDIPTFGVGRIHSMYMYPMTFDEFLLHFNHFCESILVGKQQPPHRLRLQTDGEARLHYLPFIVPVGAAMLAGAGWAAATAAVVEVGVAVNIAY